MHPDRIGVLPVSRPVPTAGAGDCSGEAVRSGTGARGGLDGGGAGADPEPGIQPPECWGELLDSRPVPAAGAGGWRGEVVRSGTGACGGPDGGEAGADTKTGVRPPVCWSELPEGAGLRPPAGPRTCLGLAAHEWVPQGPEQPQRKAFHGVCRGAPRLESGTPWRSLLHIGYETGSGRVAADVGRRPPHEETRQEPPSH
ncbi:hypothetical protein NDU88_002063 [Pleurodeles waltl]|uniref:Uncharacterized protein n=1 Tax=Pleurodeles waltl TaxID=8319 RepID=A0AAV7Q8R1_PLEWA|nr:hypothetical protein NDU88_002063 [Pleurodeles waltl]